MSEAPSEFFSYDRTTGFASPAETLRDPVLDLQSLLIPHPAATFFMRLAGHNWRSSGFWSGDLLIVDRSLPWRHQQWVVGASAGELQLFQLRENSLGRLEAWGAWGNRVSPAQELLLWGGVAHVVRSLV